MKFQYVISPPFLNRSSWNLTCTFPSDNVPTHLVARRARSAISDCLVLTLVLSLKFSWVFLPPPPPPAYTACVSNWFVSVSGAFDQHYGITLLCGVFTNDLLPSPSHLDDDVVYGFHIYHNVVWLMVSEGQSVCVWWGVGGGGGVYRLVRPGTPTIISYTMGCPYATHPCHNITCILLSCPNEVGWRCCLSHVWVLVDGCWFRWSWCLHILCWKMPHQVYIH